MGAIRGSISAARGSKELNNIGRASRNNAGTLSSTSLTGIYIYIYIYIYI